MHQFLLFSAAAHWPDPVKALRSAAFPVVLAAGALLPSLAIICGAAFPVSVVFAALVLTAANGSSPLPVAAVVLLFGFPYWCHLGGSSFSFFIFLRCFVWCCDVFR